MTSPGINWAEIHQKLPFERTPEQKAKRMDMFRQFDPNGNGFLSLAEVSRKIKFVYCRNNVKKWQQQVQSNISKLYQNMFCISDRKRNPGCCAMRCSVQIKASNTSGFPPSKEGWPKHWRERWWLPGTTGIPTVPATPASILWIYAGFQEVLINF